MDWVTIRKVGKRYFGKYKFLLLILALGIFLMNFPGNVQESEREEPVIYAEQLNLEDRLQDILGAIQGVGEVRVLLTESSGEEYRYQVDEQMGSEGSVTRRETVILRDANRNESGLVETVIPPSYRGAIVVCQGGDNALVKLAVIEAVGSVTGIPSSRITVWKMN